MTRFTWEQLTIFEMNRSLIVLSSTVFCMISTDSFAVQVVDITPIHDRMVCLHLNEGSVEHHKRGQKRSDEKVIIFPLDLIKASEKASYSFTSKDDRAFQTEVNPIIVGRKSKGTDFAWFADSWENGRAVNKRPDHTKEHWIYLTLPKAMKPGATYVLYAPNVTGAHKPQIKFTFGEERSEAVHVNLLGYVPSAPQKFGYLYHWAGDQGGVDFSRYVDKKFALIDESGKERFSGAVKFRMPKTQQETLQLNDSKPYGNFLNADVY